SSCVPVLFSFVRQTFNPKKIATPGLSYTWNNRSSEAHKLQFQGFRFLMATNYDTIADEYKRSKLQPWRRFIECFTLFELIGDVRGKAVLDLACGEGFYSRQLKERGAARGPGVDLSEGMIDLARSQEAREPMGIEYIVADAKELRLAEDFDLVV